MNKELEALERLWEETKGNPNTSSMSNRSDRDLIKQALSTQVSDSEVEELFKWFDGIVMSNTGSAIKTSKLNQLKTKFAQMERENVVLFNLNDEYLKNSITNENQLNQYKQLLDEVELLEDELGWYIKVGTEREYISLHFYNILKQLKSIGSDKNE